MSIWVALHEITPPGREMIGKELTLLWMYSVLLRPLSQKTWLTQKTTPDTSRKPLDRIELMIRVTNEQPSRGLPEDVGILPLPSGKNGEGLPTFPVYCYLRYRVDSRGNRQGSLQFRKVPGIR